MAIAIIGTGITQFGELWDSSWEELVREACMEAIKNANVEVNEIDCGYFGNMNLSRFDGQDHLVARINEFLGLSHVFRTEAACASGSVALKLAATQVELAALRGENDVALVCGFEKMTDQMTGRTTNILASASHFDTEVMNGATFPGLYALLAQRYLHETGATEQDLHAIAIKNHKNATQNKKAMYRKEITMSHFKSHVATPLSLFDCSPISDGAAAMLVTTEKCAKYLGVEYVKLEDIEVCNSSISLAKRFDPLVLDAGVCASKRVYKRMGISPRDIDLIEVHDCFTINEILCLEAAGFAKRGEGYNLIRSILPYDSINQLTPPVPYTVDGRQLYVNTSGGLKAKGHPVGATGVAQIIEVCDQILGKAGGRNVNPNIGAALNIGGTGGTAVFSVLRR
ncbi:MAG: thiolase domain-containing protein [Candidatus Aenigmarchaeota archaeon]|nr:thiolase domain-containing protein [Candidatus Aenigmarchaeota archaeon]